eukprot:gnl/MRDRNA2_/MRDRNA2_80029_c0_seq2.p1 gnl/MRDRNA2_/MRDRNA2_80029_c0~~gnl/MRDRNA2_/MRDRNA2_80029_c0_seq2.p1  ORF type:complete len:264 (-),score=74.77 gnl/MRDRNA2_/MRDRNA2_80029_c0_seq2:229-1020(-)
MALVKLQKQSEVDTQTVSDLQSTLPQAVDNLSQSLAHRQKEVEHLREQAIKVSKQKQEALDLLAGCRADLATSQTEATKEKALADQASTELAAERAYRAKSDVYLDAIEKELSPEMTRQDHLSQRLVCFEDELAALHEQIMLDRIHHAQAERTWQVELQEQRKTFELQEATCMDDSKRQEEIEKQLSQEALAQASEALAQLAVERAYREKAAMYLNAVEKERDYFCSQAKELSAKVDADRRAASETSIQFSHDMLHRELHNKM